MNPTLARLLFPPSCPLVPLPSFTTALTDRAYSPDTALVLGGVVIEGVILSFIGGSVRRDAYTNADVPLRRQRGSTFGLAFLLS